MVTKYYFAGAQRVAMRKNGTLYYLLADHLGSTSLTTNTSGALVSELRYKAWGETRYSSGTMPTSYRYTGQREEASFGPYFYNARWYDPYLNHFTQPDSIVPDPYNPQDWNRYSYARYNPVRYTDPSGHRACDERDGCTITPKPQTGCSVGQGYFNGSFKCTPAQLNKATIAQRQSWFNEMLASADPALVEEFNNINGILNAFIATDTGAPDTWASWGDAGILGSIQNGLAMFLGESFKLGSSPLLNIATNAWNEYFESFATTGRSNKTLQLWGAAEGAGTRYGKWLAQENGAIKSPGEMMFLLVGDAYRDTLSVRQDPATMGDPQWSANLYGWFFDTSSTIPSTDIAPVSLFGYFLLQWK